MGIFNQIEGSALEKSILACSSWKLWRAMQGQVNLGEKFLPCEGHAVRDKIVSPYITSVIKGKFLMGGIYRQVHNCSAPRTDLGAMADCSRYLLLITLASRRLFIMH